MSTPAKVGLVLSGGGARGAYQIGVLKAIAELIQKKPELLRFKVITGASAGAINAAALASFSDDFVRSTKFLERLWSNITSEKVFHTDAMNLGKIGLKWMGELSFGGLTGVGASSSRSLLDTKPLHELLKNNLPFHRIERNITEGNIDAVAVTALDYADSTAITFVQGNSNLPNWNKSRKKSLRAKLTTEHVMASSAIPMLFPSVAVGDQFFGDGCVRNSHPCGPAIYLGASRLMVIGVRQQTETAFEHRGQTAQSAPSVARVANVILNAVMLDNIEQDVERLERVNEFLERLPELSRQQINYKKVDYVCVSPSEDIGELARQMADHLPRVIRYLIKGLGSLDDASEIVSYLLFNPDFCKRLIEIGYKDGKNQIDQIEQLLSDT